MDRVAGRIVLAWGWRRWLLAFLAGAILVLAQAPYDFPAVGFLSFPVLVWLLDGTASEPGARLLARLRPSFAVGWWFGFGYFIFGLWWIGNALLVEAESFAWALPLAMVALPALLAIFFGLATMLARLFWSDSLGRIAALAASFAILEWLRGMIFTGFPWNAIGYAIMPVPVLMQSAVLGGMTGLTALAVFLFALPAQLVAARGRWAAYGLALLLVLGHIGFGLWRLSGAGAEGDALSVRLVQPSILQSQKWDGAERDRIFGTYLELSARPPAEGQEAPQVIIWPETAAPFILNDRPDALSALGDLLTDGQMLLVGAVRSEAAGGAAGATRYYNSIVAVDENGAIVDAIDKVHLVPFGEYLPFSAILNRLGLSKIVVLPEDFSSGVTRAPLTLVNGLRAVAFICYEIIFDGVVRKDAAGSDLLVNLTNDAWFGDTAGPYQHFRQAQLRAVETGLPLIRAANNGISGVVDGYGRVVDAIGIDAVDALDIRVPLAKAERLRPVDPQWAGWGAVVLLGLSGACASLLSRRKVN